MCVCERSGLCNFYFVLNRFVFCNLMQKEDRDCVCVNERKRNYDANEESRMKEVGNNSRLRHSKRFSRKYAVNYFNL